MSTTFGDLIRFWARWQPERTMIRFQGAGVTWAIFDQRTDALAAGLTAAGVARGDRVAVLMENCVEYLEAIGAASKLGAVVVPINHRWTAAEMVYPLQDSEPSVLLTEASFVPIVDQLRNEVDDFDVFVLGDIAESQHGELAELYAAGSAPVVDVEPQDAVLLCYTSGTTGVPKGAMLSHGSILAAGLGKALCDGITWREVILCPVPLAMTAGCVTLFMQGCLVTGATLVLEREFVPSRCLELIEQERISLITAVPVFLEMMEADPSFPTRDLSSLKWITSGGSSVPLKLLEAWQARGVAMTQAYGLTEASGGCAYLNASDAARKIGYAGVPIPATRVRIVGPGGEQLGAGEIGEIVLQGPGVMLGYYNRPAETAAVLQDGWLHTGDLGLVDDEGFLKVVDRKKDMIISGGINVYPAEIERTLATVAGIGEFAVIGVPDERWGEVPMLVVANGDGLDIDSLIGVIRGQLADYKRPRYLTVHGGPLPRNASGKVLKPELRQRYPSAPGDCVDLKRG